MSRRKICVVTGTRAEYGLLYWLMKEISNDSELQLQIIATGMHLSPEFGLTYKIIEQDGFKIDEKVEMLLSSDTPVGIAKSIGLGVIGFADALERLKPDIVVLLGDRYEVLAAAQAALVARIPVAHIHGGELTEGLIDEAIRHSVTKMAQLHFVAAEPYRRRVIQLGELPDKVFNFGAPGLDYIVNTKLLSKIDLETQLNFRFDEINFLVTYHPVTLRKDTKTAIQELLLALDQFPEAKIIFTKANSDTNGRIINEAIQRYIDLNPKRAALYASLGQLRYLSCLQYVDAVIGNSSSGIIEVPMFKKPTVNIGDRQKGRLRGSTVIDCKENQKSISTSIKKAISQEFKILASNSNNIYGNENGHASKKIKAKLKSVILSKEDIILKPFFDVEVGICE